MCGGFVLRALAELGMTFEDVLDDAVGPPDAQVELLAEAFWRHGCLFECRPLLIRLVGLKS
jgi:hypothetical protein